MTRSRFNQPPDWVNFCRAGGCALALGIVVGAGGCHLMVNPYTDEIAMEPAVTTPSAEQAQAAQVAVTVTQRDYDLVEMRVEDGSVTHGPLYFEDPFEDRGSEDGRFAWSGEEYLYFLHGPGCFLLKGLVFPISAVVTPPWVTMASDGRVSQRAWSMVHDARRQAREPVNE